MSEDDYIGYLAESGIGGVLPVTVAARLRRSHFLFLGLRARRLEFSGVPATPLA